MSLTIQQKLRINAEVYSDDPQLVSGLLEAANIIDAHEAIISEEVLHPIKDWAICGIASNSSKGSEGRKSRMETYYKFIDLVNKSKQLLKQDNK